MSPRVTMARLRRLIRRDDGVTLAELIVTMGLSTLIGAMTLGVFLGINSSTASTTDRAINTAAARSTIQAWTADLRVTDGTTPGVRTNRIEWLDVKDMLFYADLRNRSMDNVATTSAATMIWLRLDSTGTLVEERFASNAAAGANPTICRLLEHNVTATALFTGVNSSGPVPSDPPGTLGTAPAASAGCRPLPVTVPSRVSHPSATQQAAQANLQNLLSVQIDFVVRDTKNAHPIEFTSQAVLPSLGGV
jgi:hypothetical protein